MVAATLAELGEVGSRQCVPVAIHIGSALGIRQHSPHSADIMNAVVPVTLGGLTYLRQDDVNSMWLIYHLYHQHIKHKI